MADVSRLPNVVAEEWEWQLHGSCRGADSSLFFHTDNERGSARERREGRAEGICPACPVLAPCRPHAMTVQGPDGVWGGVGGIERRERFLPAGRGGRGGMRT